MYHVSLYLFCMDIQGTRDIVSPLMKYLMEVLRTEATSSEMTAWQVCFACACVCTVTSCLVS